MRPHSANLNHLGVASALAKEAVLPVTTHLLKNSDTAEVLRFL